MSKGFSPKDFLKEEVLKHLDENEALLKLLPLLVQMKGNIILPC